ncbi:MAG: MFS transporter [Syntrophobacteraceae bacterium]|nr:MFS transporter [Syntrophobacteraceae bacterium]
MKSKELETESRAAGVRKISRSLVLLMAAGAGLTVANIYYAQPLLDVIRRSLGMSVATAGLIVTASQLGYGLGLTFLVPLGDLVERRLLVVAMTVGISFCLAAIAFAPFSWVLLAASLLVGALSAVAQVLVAFAASLAGPTQMGRVVGTVMSGLLLGILLARTAAGYLAQFEGWRAVFALASAITVALALVFHRGLPRYRVHVGVGYPALIKSVFSLLLEEPLLRLRALYGAIAFAAFSVFWTPLALMLSRPPHRFSSGAIGMFGMAGVAGALSASLAGQMSDRGLSRPMTGITSALLALSWIPLKLGGHSVWILIAGIILLDFAVQGLHITNQGEIYTLPADVRSRITSAYMTAFFAGGVFGSALSSFTYARFGWNGVCLAGACLGVAATALWIVAPHRKTQFQNEKT